VIKRGTRTRLPDCGVRPQAVVFGKILLLEEREIDLLILGLHRNTHLGMQNRTSGAFPIIVKKAKCPVVTVAGCDVLASNPR
jgi:hypothetical protein